MLLQMPLFYIIKMMMLIFYVTVICLYLCLYVSVSGLPSFKEHISRNISVVAAKFSKCDTENIT